mmetsp:Transcript_3421/g.6936  ORF Transcript_3421/g.6936 Transcript_3421/m.6936 type:complete len:254 (-) Transcript_3421:97-858(-)|eukprot:CAMPEP_0118800448 /NCGR_PEP_ID=MMETSP1161-20130426/2350_1 /TAXON_ID=249345 /ORGANISM="Picochlorum oklahomensis, Strain CCMP2329" /LENGTH=253 /DNA_ID=CAMNT_0006728275 /DNA_START=61 /DNA_END=822 /DNA_ORIENTATION=-
MTSVQHKSYLSLSILLAALLFIGAVSADKNIDVTGFSSIQNCGAVPIIVTPGDSYSVVVTGDAAASAATTGSVSPDGELSFTIAGPMETSSAYYITVTMPSDALEAVRVSGSGPVYVNSGFTAKDFAVTISGSGDVTLSADVTDTLSITINGSGDLEATGTVANVDLQINGSGDVYVGGASGSQITGNVFGSGDVSYSGGECNVSRFASNACSQVSAKAVTPTSVDSVPAVSFRVQGTCSCTGNSNCITNIGA